LQEWWVHEHQHLVSLINFKTVWQPKCTSNFCLQVHQGVFSIFTYKNWTHAVIFPKSILHQSGKAYFQELWVHEHQHLDSLINFNALWQPQCTKNSGLLMVHQGAFSMFTMKTLNTCCIISKVHLVSVSKGIFAGVVSEHQHLASLIDFNAVWQPHSALVILACWFKNSAHSLCRHWTHAVLFPKSILYQIKKFICRCGKWTLASCYFSWFQNNVAATVY